MPFPFQISATEGRARAGVLKTARGDIRTPAFMPVGTAATVKAMTVDQVKATGADILLGNTYHLMLRPGPERMERLGGLRQVHGLGQADPDRQWRVPGHVPGRHLKVKEEAVTFSSHIDGSKHVLTPERSIEIRPTGSAPTSRCSWTSASPIRREGCSQRGDGAVDPLGRALQGPFRPA